MQSVSVWIAPVSLFRRAQCHQSSYSLSQNKNQYAYKVTHKLQPAPEMFVQSCLCADGLSHPLLTFLFELSPPPLPH